MGAFADYFGITSNNDTGSYVANSGNYNSTYGLSNYYWSSQRSTNCTWSVALGYGNMNTITVTSKYSVRIGATF